MKVIGRMIARGTGSSFRRKNVSPILGKPMLWWALSEAKKASFIDEIFVWTEDDEIAEITRQCGCHPIPRTTDQLFYYSGMSDVAEWSKIQTDYIMEKCGTLGEYNVMLNCNVCLISAEILETMFSKLLKDEDAARILPIAKVKPGLYTKNPKTNTLFPVWASPTMGSTEFPDLYRASGVCIIRTSMTKAKKRIYHEVAPEYILDVHDKDDVRLAEFYLMKRLGGKVVLHDSREHEKGGTR